ncbi:MAG: PASTA domain-containing protein [Oscillospiraceae bacterium]|nr:PASTA domain-containing protein [Oscillospiraceae bacterium]
MENLNNLCLGCMKDIGSAHQCPFCGYKRGTAQPLPYLPAATKIDGRYYLGKVLDSNGDGATYIAWHIDRNVPVTVREYLPDAITSRTEGNPWLHVMSGCEYVFADCMQGFLDLWRKLARMRGLSALFPVIDIVEENNTVYAVSEYIEGVALRDYILRSPSGYLSWEQLRVLLVPVLSTLGALHNAGIIHRGLSQNTLIVCRDGRLRISGFSIWQVRSAVGELNAELVDGFAALEQYGIDLQQGTWTDVYALGALLYRMLIGAVPLDSSKRAANDTLVIPARFAERLPSFVMNAMINALQVLPEDRTKTIEQLRAELLAAAPSQPAAVRTTAPVRTQPQSAQSPVPRPRATNASAAAPAPAAPPAPVAAVPAAASSPKQSPDKGLKVTMLVLLSVLFCAVLVIGGYLLNERGAFDALFDGDGTSVTEGGTLAMRTVPDFVGKTRSSVENSPAYVQDFVFEFVDENTMEYDVGVIFRQSIEQNSQVAKGTALKLYVSIGPRQVTIPDVSGLTYESAEAQLKALGLVCERSPKYNDGTHAAGTVEGTQPAIGSMVMEGSTVYINVWREPETQVPTTRGSIWDVLG